MPNRTIVDLKKDILATAFKFRCKPQDCESFRQIFEQQSILAADLCNELFHNTFRAWRDQSTDRWREIYKREAKQIRVSYRGRLPDAVLQGCLRLVEAQFANGVKREKLRQRLELPRFSAKSIPIRSDRGMRFKRLASGQKGKKLVVEVQVVLLPGRQAQPVVQLHLKDDNAVATVERILRGYEARCQSGGSKEQLTSADSWPPSSGGSVIYDRDSREFYLSIGYSRPALRARDTDPQRIMAIDVGIRSPLTVAFNWNKQPCRLDWLGQMILDSRSQFYKRRRLLQAKFATAPRRVYRQQLRKLSEKWQGELQKLMGNTCAHMREIVEENRVGRVLIDRPEAKEPTFFTVEFRGEKFKVPIATLLDMLEQDLKELLGEENVDARPFYWSSQICCKCGAWNKGFTWAYRRENGWPDFSCPSCSSKIDADENAALVMLRDDYEQIVQQIRQQRDKAAAVFDR